MGILNPQSREKSWTQRSGALAGVALLHGVVVAGLLHMRSSPPPAVAEIAIQVVNLATVTQESPPPELPVATLLPPPEVAIPVVPIHIALPAQVIPSPPPASPAPAVAARPMPAAPRSEGPVMLEVDEVDYVRLPEPRYPRAARQARLQGTVLLWVVIGADGHPAEVRVHQSSGHAQLDREACDAVRRAVFKPYRRNGEALSAQVIVPIEFSLTVRSARRG